MSAALDSLAEAEAEADADAEACFRRFRARVEAVREGLWKRVIMSRGLCCGVISDRLGLVRRCLCGCDVMVV